MLLASPGLAQTNSWTGTVSSNFNTPGNWSSGPPTGNVVIDYRPANRPILNDAATLGSAAVSTDMTVTATGRLQSTGMTQTGGTIDNSGTIVGGMRIEAGGKLNNTGGLITGGLSSAGTVTTTGAIQGDIINRGTGSFSVLTGAATGNGTFTNQDQATLAVRTRLTGLTTLTNSSTAGVGVVLDPGAMLSADAVTNAAGATMSVRGNLSSGSALTNAGTLTVIDSGVVNGGVANTGTILNGGVLNGGLSNTGTVTNTTPGTINGPVRSSGAITNLGTINDRVTIEDGLFDNKGRLRDHVTLVGGKLVSTATASALENGLTNSATAEIAGTLTGPIDNRSGGRITLTGDTAGNGVVTNAASATLALTGGSFSGLNTIDNAGSLTASGTRSLGTAGLRNLATGSVSLENGSAADRLTINGLYDGTAGSRLGVDVNLAKGTAGSDRITVNGTATGASTLAITNVGGSHGLLSQPLDIISVGSGSSLTLNRGRIAALPYVNYYLDESAPGSGTYQLTSQFNSAPLTSLATGLSGALASASAALHHPLNPIISRPIGCAINEITASPFIRLAGGNDRTSASASAEAPDGASTLKSRTSTSTGGFHGGLDFGICNVGGSRWNLHLGISGGHLATTATATTDMPGRAGAGTQQARSTVKLDMPFFALHAMAAYEGFTAELAVRQEQIGATIGTTSDGVTYLRDGKLTSRGLSLNGLIAYRIALPYAFFLEPHVGISKGSASFKPLTLGTGASDTLRLSGTDMGHARFGLNMGTSLRLESGAIISPFAHFSLWSALGSSVSGQANLGSIGETVAVKGEAAGNFVQAGGGVMLRSLGGGFSAFVRGDARFGGKTSGQSFTGGVRLTF